MWGNDWRILRLVVSLSLAVLWDWLWCSGVRHWRRSEAWCRPGMAPQTAARDAQYGLGQGWVPSIERHQTYTWHTLCQAQLSPVYEYVSQCQFLLHTYEVQGWRSRSDTDDGAGYEGWQSAALGLWWPRRLPTLVSIVAQFVWTMTCRQMGRYNGWLETMWRDDKQNSERIRQHSSGPVSQPVLLLTRRTANLANLWLLFNCCHLILIIELFGSRT